MFQPDREPDHVVAQAHGGELRLAQLQMRGRGRVDHQRLGVADIGQVRGEPARLDEPRTRNAPAFDAEADDRAGTLRQQALGQRVVGVVRPRRVDDVGDAGLAGQEIEHGRGVGDVPLHAQRQRLDAEQQVKRVLRAQAGAEIA